MSHHPRILISYRVNQLSPVKRWVEGRPDWIEGQWIIIRGFRTRMVYLKHAIYCQDIPVWSGTLEMNPRPSLAQWLSSPPGERQTRGTIPAFSAGIFPGRVIPVTSVGAPVTSLPGVLRYRIGAGISWPGVSVL